MSTFSDQRPILDRYFEAWQSLDKSQVRQLFHEMATYKRDGKPSFIGVDQIEAYWQRNQNRQTGLSVFQYVPDKDRPNVCTFCARFIDSEEKQTQTVFGWIELEVAEGKISCLHERYNVHREPLDIQATQSWGSWFDELFKWARWKAVETWTRLIEVLAVHGTRIVYRTLLLVLGGTAVGAALGGIGKLPDIVLCTLALKFAACGVGESTLREGLQGDAIRHLSYFAFVAILSLPVLHRFRHSFLMPVETVRLVGEGQDLVEMKKRFRGAKDLLIYAGDFDFVGRDAEFRSIFIELDKLGGLELVSDKTEAVVRDGFGKEPEATFLLNSLIRRGRIRFEDSRRLRCSIVRRWDYPEVLYRYEHGGGQEERHRLRICVLRGRGDVGPVVELLRKSARNAA